MIDREEACRRLEDEDLTDWETDFIASLVERDRELSERQAEVLARMVRRYLHEDCEPSDFE